MISAAERTGTGRNITGSVPTSRVLVVEDDDDMREVLIEGLASDGHAVRGCARVDEALGALESEPFDVLITDMRLPGASGMELLSVLHARGVTAPARIVITGFGSEDLHDSVEALGAVAVFDKPFDVDDLRSAVWSATS